VRVFRSVEHWGFHFFASDEPLGRLDAAKMAERLPEAARTDLLEWGPYRNSEIQLRSVVDSELSIGALLGSDGQFPALDDDRPLNEYDWLRTHASRREPGPRARSRLPVH